MAATLLLPLAIAILALGHSRGSAEQWSRERIARLPDSAFAAIETAPNGKKVRHLPHHDESGAVDPAHLKAALSRLPQVKWINPATREAARRHLEEHASERSSKTSTDPTVRSTIHMRNSSTPH